MVYNRTESTSNSSSNKRRLKEMRPMRNQQSWGRLMLACVSLCICLAGIRLAEAGKGKGGRQGHIIIQNEIKDGHQRMVPIYMPIPIPVPMPMGPQQHQGHHESRHHQQRGGGGGQDNGNDEGEVKKIYLLQPMPKIQAQLKGPQPIVGPVQTHIHLPVPMAAPARPARHNMNQQQNQFHHQQRPNQFQQASYGAGGHLEGDGGDLQHRPPPRGHMSVPGQSDMKILPIVVIPPMAPMPPIQLQTTGGDHLSGQHHHHHHRDLFTESRHVRTSQPASEHRPIRQARHRAFPPATPPQQEYGGSGGGAAFREAYAGREAVHRRRPARHQPTRSSGYQAADYDDYGDYGPPPPPPRPRAAAASQHQARSARGPPRPRRRQPTNNWAASEERRWATAGGSGRDSIRDIIDQQVVFDDEPEPAMDRDCCGGGGGGGELGSAPPRRARPLPESDFNELGEPVNQPPADSYRGSQRASRLSAHDRAELADYIDGPSSSSSSLSTGPQHHSKQPDPTYYEHDLSPGNKQEAPPAPGNKGGRLYSSEREALEDDEWWFDTIKSVAHASPQPENNNNGTTSNGNALNTTTTTVAPSTITTTVGQGATNLDQSNHL